jgi:hypothetical protein
MFIGHGGSTARVSTEPIGAEKPSLLQVADFVAYFFAKSRARRPSGPTLRFKALTDRLKPFVGQVRLGPDGGLGASMPTDAVAAHLRTLVD